MPVDILEKFFEQFNYFIVTLQHIKQLPCGVMVARRILVPPVRVRILPRQQIII